MPEPRDRAERLDPARRHASPSSPASSSRSSVRRARARPPPRCSSRASTTSKQGAVRIDGHDVRDLTLESLRAAVGFVTQDPHLFHDTIRANLRYAKPDATDAELVDACRAARIHDLVDEPARRLRHDRRRARLPPVGRREAAARDRPGAAEGPGDRDPRRGDVPPRLRVRARDPARARRGARGPHRDRDRPPPVDDRQRRPHPRARRRRASSSRAPTTSCSRANGLYADLYRTQLDRDELERTPGLFGPAGRPTRRSWPHRPPRRPSRPVPSRFPFRFPRR